MERLSRRDLFKAGIGAMAGLVVGKTDVVLGHHKDKQQDEGIKEVNAEALIAYRQGVDAERLIIGAMGLTPYDLEYYRLLYEDAIHRQKEGEYVLSPGFWKTLLESTPTETPTPMPSTKSRG